jgi:hypothetical protein
MEQGGDWAKNAALLPYLRMITWLDPHFIEAYDIAGTILSELKRYPEAKAFVTEGIKHNGTNWQMYYDMAMIDAWYCKDPKSALPFAIKAYDYVEDPFYKRRMGWLVATLKSDISPSTGASSSHPLAVSRQLKN